MPSHALTLVSVPPPTPNGDLHVGHLSGPYLGADVFCRYNRLRSQPIVSAFSSDRNQSYVVTTAERLQTEPQVLANKSHECFGHTLDLAEISFDLLGMPDQRYSSYVARHFALLNQSGALVLKNVDTFFHRPSGRYLFESYAQGRCNVCLAATKGNICENCGHPNDPLKLLDLQATGYPHEQGAFELRPVPTLVLELERYRQRIERHLETLQATMRPELAKLCDDLLSEQLRDFPITYMSDWGISAASLGLPGTVINVWAEMQPGHVYWLSEAWKNSYNFDGHPLSERTVDYVQFLGFDNSFFYTFAHLALAFAAHDAGLFAPLPTAFITNEFYQLENYKFSTSQGHLIWARDLLANHVADEVRFYLCWSNPEHQKANFTPADLRAIIDRYFHKPISTISDRLETNGLDLGMNGTPDPDVALAAKAAQRRLENAYRASSFSLRRAAQTLVDLLDWCAQLANRAESGSEHAMANFRTVLDVTVLGLAPIAPAVSSRLWRAGGHTEPMSWGEKSDFVAASPRLVAGE
ncbi:class I tRNA ligase family protein [Rhizobium mongolense]|uniref:class I tRNA ligase family protein n=1 Tax=Rhizobium mongolense TaxID=57676 RepID=UPI003557B3DC